LCIVERLEAAARAALKGCSPWPLEDGQKGEQDISRSYREHREENGTALCASMAKVRSNGSVSCLQEVQYFVDVGVSKVREHFAERGQRKNSKENGRETKTAGFSRQEAAWRAAVRRLK
jgi:hypothetical protein